MLNKEFILDTLRTSKRPQTSGNFWEGHWSIPDVPTCAIGCITLAYAKNGDPHPSISAVIRTLEEVWGAGVYDDIIRWNDKYRLTFAQIADKLEMKGA